MYESAISTAAGVMAGTLLGPVYYGKIKPFFRAVRLSGVPIRKLDAKKATSLDRALNEWGSLDPSSKGMNELAALRGAMPEDIQKIFDSHINTNWVYITIDMNDPAATLENLLQRKAVLRERVNSLYKEPAFQAYLRKR